MIGKPFGLRGDVYVHPDPDIEPDLAVGERFRLADGREVEVVGGHEHGGRTVVRFDGFPDRAAAETLRGQRLLVSKATIETDEDTYWTADLLGREVVDPDGALLGVVEDIRDGIAHDYLVVARPDGGELVVPAVDDLLEIEDERIVVRPVPGMLE